MNSSHNTGHFVAVELDDRIFDSDLFHLHLLILGVRRANPRHIGSSPSEPPAYWEFAERTPGILGIRRANPLPLVQSNCYRSKMSTVISIDSLSRSYRTYRKASGIMNSIRGFWNRTYEEKRALLPTTLSIDAGQIVGLVGANGAGKTTLLKLLSGLIYPTAGTADILGFRPWERKREFLRQISLLLGQKSQLWWDLPAADSFSLLARIYDLPDEQARRDYEELAERLHCTEQLHVQLRRLSLGERMKMEIIGSLLHRPRLLFLDEPTIRTLDVMAQKTIPGFSFSRYVDQYKPTIMLTSHYMDDISPT